MRGALADLRTGMRNLKRRPGLTVGVVVTIGLGIGSTATIYSVVDGVVLRPLPYEDGGRLVAVGAISLGTTSVDPATGLQDLSPMSSASLDALRRRAGSFEALAAIQPFRILMSEENGTEQFVGGARIDPQLLELLGVSPILGRTFTPDEFVGGQTNAVLIGHGFWHTRYAGDPGVLGRTFEWTNALGVQPTIVGILPPDFRPPEAFFPQGEAPEVYTPMAMVASEFVGRQLALNLSVIGRLSGGTTLEQARSELELISREPAAIARGLPPLPGGRSRPLGVNGLHAETVGSAGQTLWIFLGASGLLLLLTVMNAATLLLARGLDRRQELSIRVALGARRIRVVRLLISEAAILCFAGGLSGIALAYGGVASFLHLAPRSIPRLDAVSVDGRVLTVAVLATLVTGLCAGLLPALGLARRDAWEGLQSRGRSVSESGARMRTLLVGGQLALATVLLSGAGLLFNSFMHLRAADPGFEPDGLVVMSPVSAGPELILLRARSTYYERWDQVLAAQTNVPGVRGAAGGSGLPFQTPKWIPRLTMEGDSPESIRFGIAGYAVTPGFLTTLGVELREGRMLGEEDGPDAERVVLVNEEFVRTQLDGREAIGTLVTRTDESASGAVTRSVPMRIVGVVENAVQARSEDGPSPAIYIPHAQAELQQLMEWWSVARTDRTPEAVMPELRASLAGVAIRAENLGTMRDRISLSQVTPHFRALLLGAFAGVALLLAAAGLYGSVAHAVRLRERELGVRIALGADRASVLGLVMRQGMRVSAVGLVLGLGATLAMTRVLSSLLYDVRSYDPLTLVGMGAVLMLVCALACFAPAWRATAVDPVRALQAE